MAGRPSKMTDDVRRRLIKRYNNGDDLETIDRSFDMCSQTVRRAIRAHKAAQTEADQEG